MAPLRSGLLSPPFLSGPSAAYTGLRGSPGLLVSLCERLLSPVVEEAGGAIEELIEA